MMRHPQHWSRAVLQAAQRNEKVWGPQMGVAGREVAVTVFLGKSPGSMSTV